MITDTQLSPNNYNDSGNDGDREPLLASIMHVFSADDPKKWLGGAAASTLPHLSGGGWSRYVQQFEIIFD